MAGQRSHASRQREPSTTTTTKQQQKQRVEQRVMGGEQLQVENRIEGGGLSGNGVVAAAAATTHARGGRCRRHRRCGAPGSIERAARGFDELVCSVCGGATGVGRRSGWCTGPDVGPRVCFDDFGFDELCD